MELKEMPVSKRVGEGHETSGTGDPQHMAEPTPDTNAQLMKPPELMKYP
jgi:hypothetical protein